MAKPVHQVVIHPTAMAGVAAMTLFSEHSFPRHSHDQYGIGIMTSSAQRSWSVVGQVESAAGDVIMLNPGELHDGRPAERSARGWKILYFDPVVIARELANEITNGEFLIQPVARDPRRSAAVFTPSRLCRMKRSSFASTPWQSLAIVARPMRCAISPTWASPIRPPPIYSKMRTAHSLMCFDSIRSLASS